MRCSSCGHDFPGAYGDSCPACGQVAASPLGFPGAAPVDPQPPVESPWTSPKVSPVSSEEGRRGGIPWEAQQSVESALKTVKVVLLETVDTFTNAEKGVGVGPSLVFALLLGIIGGAASVGWQALIDIAGASAGLFEGLDPEIQQAFGGFFGAYESRWIVQLVALPVQLVFGLFLWAGIVHVVLLALSGANAGFEATFRAMAYATGATAPLMIVPVMGGIVAGVWAIVIEILAVRALHETTGGKAAAAVLLPIGILLACCCCIPALIGGVLGTSLLGLGSE